jgi:hypothetical protein
MLMHDLGFRPARPDEEARILVRRAPGETERASTLEPDYQIPAAVLSGNPLVSYSGIRREAPLGLASLGAARLHARPAWFLISPTWSIEMDAVAGELREAAVLHRLQHPGHQLIFVCNTPVEVRFLQERGEAAFFYNKTANTLERIFRPLEGIAVEFDAIYNAQLLPWKRHELTLGIEKCAFLFYRDPSAQDSASAATTILARHAAVPGHVFINPLDTHGLPVKMSRAAVNQHLNRAAVGLCLSAKEGPMFASTEYLLAGLPIVTTPSVGGRDVYHDEEYCWTVPPDPRSVADAVRALKARNVPGAYIRERTLRRLELDRGRFLTLINRILEAGGTKRRVSSEWPFRKEVTMQWLPRGEAVERAAHGVVDAFNPATSWSRRWQNAFRRLRRHRGPE